MCGVIDVIQITCYNCCFCMLNYSVDDGGGMDPDKLRQCMSLGYSVKSKIASTIGQCKFGGINYLNLQNYFGQILMSS